MRRVPISVGLWILRGPNSDWAWAIGPELGVNSNWAWALDVRILGPTGPGPTYSKAQ
jgi:hypothetical protein